MSTFAVHDGTQLEGIRTENYPVHLTLNRNIIILEQLITKSL